MSDPYSFVRESNRIEGIHRGYTDMEIEAHEAFLALDQIRIADLVGFVESIAHAKPRFLEEMNVRVGRHVPPPGGDGVRKGLIQHLAQSVRWERSPWISHVAYEKLHPFTDGNGRSRRALWAWMRLRERRDPFALGFLHSAYYEALESQRGAPA